MAEQKLDALIAEFNGAIKYLPMLADHPEWTHDECITFARKWHAVAITNLRAALAEEIKTGVSWGSQPKRWNDRIPYCRNQPTLRMMAEAVR